MGASKREYERISEEKWRQIPDAKVCTKCFDDKGLIKFIRDNSTSKGCDYCTDEYESRRKSCDVNQIISYISFCIREFYEDPAESLPYDSSEGGYFGAVIDTYDLLNDHLITNNHSLWQDIQSSFDHSSWSRKHPFLDSPSDEMKYDWKAFADYVKHKNRFFFHCGKNRAKDGAPLILKTVVSYLKKNRLFKSIDIGTIYYRGRRYEASDNLKNNLEDLGVPPLKVLLDNANRMSPAGVPIFYGASDKQTVLAEIGRKKGSKVKISEFKVAKSLKVLDLTILPTVPSIFTNVSSSTRDIRSFLHSFRNEIMAKVVWDGREHTEYVPSQVFSEYIRHMVTLKNRKIDGILYPSSQKYDGSNIALFIDNAKISENDPNSLLHFNPKKVSTTSFG